MSFAYARNDGEDEVYALSSLFNLLFRSRMIVVNAGIDLIAQVQFRIIVSLRAETDAFRHTRPIF